MSVSLTNIRKRVGFRDRRVWLNGDIGVQPLGSHTIVFVVFNFDHFLDIPVVNDGGPFTWLLINRATFGLELARVR
jgi:hypothetical protein